MSSVDDKELDALVDALLDVERRREGPSADVMTDIWSGVERHLPLDPRGETGDAPTDTGSRAASNPPPDPDAPSTGTSKAHGTPSGGGSTPMEGITAVGWKMAGIAVVSALAGGAGGAWIHARTTTPIVIVERKDALEPAAIVSDAQAPVQPPPKAPGSDFDLDLDADDAAAPKKIPTPTPSRVLRDDARSKADDALARERSLLDMGRTALARGDTDAALAAVRSLEREAPGGQLVEERELLAVQSLVTADRLEEARRRAARFHEKYPSSPLLDVVVDAVSP